MREYRESDEAEVVELLKVSMGRRSDEHWSTEFFRWKHFSSPFGESPIIVAEVDGMIVGLRAFMRWEFVAGNERFRAARAVDTATHPDYRRRGIFRTLTLAALERLEGEFDFIFNTPNPASLAGYLEMGWRTVGAVPVWARLARPARALVHLVSPLRPAGDRERAGPRLMPAGSSFDGRLRTARTADFLRWRYGQGPIAYRSVAIGEAGAIYRTRRRGRLVEATVTELVANTPAEARDLLRAVVDDSRADHVVAHFATGTPAHRGLRSSGFVRIPRRITLVARSLRSEVCPDPFEFANWSLSLGDLELF